MYFLRARMRVVISRYFRRVAPPTIITRMRARRTVNPPAHARRTLISVKSGNLWEKSKSAKTKSGYRKEI